VNHPTLNYSVQLLYPSEPSFEDLSRFLDLRFSQVTRMDVAGEHHQGFVFPELAGHCGIPPQIHITRMQQPPSPSELATLLEHTHNWEGATQATENPAVCVRVTDMFAHALPPSARLLWFRQVIAAVHEASFASAILWTPSQCVVNPEKLLDTVPIGLDAMPLYGAVNVRAFQVEGGPADQLLMDTVGLAALGLVDLQCQFSGFDRHTVAEALYASALDVFEQRVGPETVQLEGIGTAEGWPCQPTSSRADPARQVLSIVPAPMPQETIPSDTWD
jgi:hypothetical protein